MTKAVTVRLDDHDHAALVRQADQLRIQPGTLARVLVSTGLSRVGPDRSDARAAVDRLVRRSRAMAGHDAVALVSEARAALGAEG